MKISLHLQGSLLCAFGVLVLSPDTLLLRMVSHVPNYTVIFVKFSFYTLTFIFFHWLRWKSRGLEKLLSLGKFGAICGIVFGFSNLCFVLAVQHVFVANVLVIVAGNSIFSAILSRAILGEIIPLRTLIACIVCFGSILLVFSNDLHGSSSGSETLGNILALLASFTLGAYFTMLRRIELRSKSKEEPIDMIACNILSGLTVTIMSLIIGGAPSMVSTVDGILLWLQGGVLNPISFGLLTIGPAYITAPEVSLYMLLETVLGPVWVFLAGFEKPPAMSLYGGIMVIVALAANSVAAYLEERRLQAQIMAENSSSNLLELAKLEEGDENVANDGSVVELSLSSLTSGRPQAWEDIAPEENSPKPLSVLGFTAIPENANGASDARVQSKSNIGSGRQKK